jgi:hypothetical protein
MLWARAATLPEAIEVGGRIVPVVAQRRAGARAVRLRANPVAGAIEISLPPRGGADVAAALLKANHAWIAARVAGWPRPLPFVPGGRLPIDGLPVLIDWAASHPRTPTLLDGALRLGGPAEALAGRVERWLKARARTDLERRTLATAARVERPVAAVRIGDPASRWGSCAGSGTAGGARIAYSWRLILAPDWVRQSVVAHEVAHLVHANHSPAFHALNRSLDPDAAEARRWLARNGAALHWVGRAG